MSSAVNTTGSVSPHPFSGHHGRPGFTVDVDVPLPGPHPVVPAAAREAAAAQIMLAFTRLARPDEVVAGAFAAEVAEDWQTELVREEALQQVDMIAAALLPAPVRS